ncbi:hypothetical protein GRI89_13625 [Altererythrobacter salegens]|uniref:Uncharacterized protein n=1 Tax=Croceibacterium salegens TaxID=1737568 RepID=A0A6I4SZD1_9SPHN|nr:hypothetical protein [Croceibacterium salegens]MXO60580.1 hypothetical protein [Croceibacterium salegens]
MDVIGDSMFQAKLHRQDVGLPFDHADGKAGDLRPVRWSDLVAKLDAARDLRDALHGHDGASEASFDSSCARHIAALGDGKHDVNLDALANGKAPNGMTHAQIERGSDKVREK